MELCIIMPKRRLSWHALQYCTPSHGLHRLYRARFLSWSVSRNLITVNCSRHDLQTPVQCSYRSKPGRPIHPHLRVNGLLIPVNVCVHAKYSIVYSYKSTQLVAQKLQPCMHEGPQSAWHASMHDNKNRHHMSALATIWMGRGPETHPHDC
jgi:hypothetical protein